MNFKARSREKRDHIKRRRIFSAFVGVTHLPLSDISAAFLDGCCPHYDLPSLLSPEESWQPVGKGLLSLQASLTHHLLILLITEPGAHLGTTGFDFGKARLLIWQIRLCCETVSDRCEYRAHQQTRWRSHSSLATRFCRLISSIYPRRSVPQDKSSRAIAILSLFCCLTAPRIH